MRNLATTAESPDTRRRSGAPRASRAGGPFERVWGLDPIDLHDRFWAAQGVQVIRPGGEAPISPGPQLYLLLREGQTALFRLEDVVRRMNWLKPRALRIRITENRPDTYRETVQRDESGGFRSIVRTYRAERAGSLRAGVTAHPGVAREWQNAGGDRARARMLSPASHERNASMQTSGRVFAVRSEADAAALVAELQRVWTLPQVVAPSTYEYSPGVFAHESAEIPPDARLVGPLWIGGGVRVDPGALVIGPGVLADAGAHVGFTAEPVRWSDMHQPRWPSTWQSGLLRRRIAKRGFDIAFSLAVLVCTLPIYPVVMALIWIEDRRPFFFVHRRQTLRGREFGCLKFRTMRRDAHQLQAQLAQANQADGPQFFISEDPRLLRVGRVLRRLQIDEFPQFINVLLGHMSVVGPRPSPDKENQFCPAWREARLSVRPGITGLWQVRRTRMPETDFQEWIRYDLEYVQRSSMRLDVWIIIQTVLRILGR